MKGDPWLGHLWVVWAPEADQPAWALARTDDKGRLLTAAEDPRKAPVPVRWSAGTTYLAYLVTTYREDAERVLQDVTIPDGRARQGKPLSLVGEAQANKAGEQFLVLKIPESPGSYRPRGSALTLGYCLSRQMGNDSCPPVRKAVRRLQYALGAMRYPLGAQCHPYSPEDPGAPKPNDSLAPSPDPRPNAGVFDVRTWSAVLQFQRDANAGASVPAPPNAFGLLVRAAAAARETDVRAEMERFGALYARYPADPAADAAPGARTDWPDDPELTALLAAAPVPAAATLRTDAVVDEEVGQALERWIAGRQRRRGAILVPLEAARGQKHSLWGREALAAAVADWNRRLRALGWEHGVPAAHTYRDAISDMDGSTFGAAALSIHKSGLALDLRNADHAAANPVFPVILERSAGAVPRFRLWLEVSNPNDAGANSGYFADTVNEWSYQADNEAAA